MNKNHDEDVAYGVVEAAPEVDVFKDEPGDIGGDDYAPNEGGRIFEGQAEPGSPLAAFLSHASEKVVKRKLYDTHEANPLISAGFLVEFEASVTPKDIEGYQETAKRVSGKNTVDPDIANAQMLARKNTGIYMVTGEGDDVKHVKILDEDGRPLKFNSDAFLASQGHNTVIKAVTKYLGSIGLLNIAVSLLKECGFNKNMEPVDPTKG